MFNKVIITGDCHGDFSRFQNYDKELQQDFESAVIILGDAGINWTLNEQDSHVKNFLTRAYDFTIYCVRGNHEARPENVSDMHLVYDDNVGGEVYLQDKWPTIRYFKDWGIYTINGHTVGIIGGAYSVDKWYRLDRGAIWYADEQLDATERATALDFFMDKKVDFMLTHTCPLSWEPTDLFLRGINQSKVDKTMERFLEEVKDEIDAKIWCFGHYHADRIERPAVEQFFHDSEDMEEIWRRWEVYYATGNLDWWLNKSPNFYMGVEK